MRAGVVMRLCMIWCMAILAVLGAPHSKPEYWKRLNGLYLNSDYNGVAEYAESISAKLTPQAAAILLENSASQWNNARYVGQLAAAWSRLIAENKQLFLKSATTLFTAFPEAPVNILLARFANGYESILDNAEWIRQYLKKMGSKSKVRRCSSSESRECGGDFQRNLMWVIKNFPDTALSLSGFLIDWADGIFDDGQAGNTLKYAYIRSFIIPLLIMQPQDLGDLVTDSRVGPEMSARYSEIDLDDRLEVMEYALWSLQVGDNLKEMSQELQSALKWILNYLVVIDKKRCSAVIEHLAATDAFRTLSLIWQLKVCSNQIGSRSGFAALENNAPFSFAVYLHHGKGVKREQLRQHNLTKMLTLMLDVKAKTRFGQSVWAPCQKKSSSSASLTTYKWSPPVGIDELSAPSVVLVARFLLYHQFGIPFDSTKTTATSGDEALEWGELPGLATTLLERHCQLVKKYPAYKFVIHNLPSSSMVVSTKESSDRSSRSLSDSYSTSSRVSTSSGESDSFSGYDNHPRAPPPTETSYDGSESERGQELSESEEGPGVIFLPDPTDTFDDDDWINEEKSPLKPNILIQTRRRQPSSFDDDSSQSDDSEDSFREGSSEDDSDSFNDDETWIDDENVRIIRHRKKGVLKKSPKKRTFSVVDQARQARIQKIFEQLLQTRQPPAPEPEVIIEIDEEDAKKLTPDAVIVE